MHEIAKNLSAECNSIVTTDALRLKFKKNKHNEHRFLRREAVDQTADTDKNETQMDAIGEQRSESTDHGKIIKLFEVGANVWGQLDIKTREVGGRRRFYPEPEQWTMYLHYIVEKLLSTQCPFNYQFSGSKTKIQFIANCPECKCSVTITQLEKTPKDFQSEISQKQDEVVPIQMEIVGEILSFKHTKKRRLLPHQIKHLQEKLTTSKIFKTHSKMRINADNDFNG